MLSLLIESESLVSISIGSSQFILFRGVCGLLNKTGLRFILLGSNEFFLLYPENVEINI